jgi:hypothetical protein
MRKILLVNSLIVLLCMIVLNSCHDETMNDCALLKPDYLSNPNAVSFVNHLRENDNDLKQFSKILNGHIPLYGYTEIVTTPDYGICFFVPYVSKSEEQIEGAIYYPITSASEYEINCEQIDLGVPIDVTPSFLNQSIELEKRFIYGANFYYLKTDGLQVNQELTKFVDLIDGNVLPLDSEVLPQYGLTTRAGIPMIQVKTYYATSTRSSISGDGLTAITLAPETVLSIFKDVLLRYYIPLQDLKINHQYSCVIVEFPLKYLSEDPPSFILDYHDDLTFAFYVKSYGVTLHSTYVASAPQSSTGNSTSSSGGGSSGNAAIGGTTGSVAGNSESSSKKGKSKVEIDSSLVSMEKDALEFYRLFFSASKKKLGKYNYVSFDDYVDSVKSNPKIEHGSSLLQYEELNDTTILTIPKKGDAHNVKNEVGSAKLIGEIHNHPNKTTPSPKDLLFTSEMCNEKK